jgi:hypothetical protein
MDTQQLRENRALFPAAELAPYRGQWVAFTMDGRRVLASARTLGELDALLVALGEDPEKVALEFLDCEDNYLGGAETV